MPTKAGSKSKRDFQIPELVAQLKRLGKRVPTRFVHINFFVAPELNDSINKCSLDEKRQLTTSLFDVWAVCQSKQARKLFPRDFRLGKSRRVSMVMPLEVNFKGEISIWIQDLDQNIPILQLFGDSQSVLPYWALLLSHADQIEYIPYDPGVRKLEVTVTFN